MYINKVLFWTLILVTWWLIVVLWLNNHIGSNPCIKGSNLTYLSGPKSNVKIICKNVKHKLKHKYVEVCDVWPGETILGPSDYIEFGQIAERLNKDDEIYLHLYGSSGNVDGAINIINHIKNTKAITVAQIEGNIGDIFIFIALSSDVYIVPPYGFWNFDINYFKNKNKNKHKYIKNIKPISDIYDKQFLKLLLYVLTEEEISKVTNRQQVILPGKLIQYRLDTPRNLWVTYE